MGERPEQLQLTEQGGLELGRVGAKHLQRHLLAPDLVEGAVRGSRPTLPERTEEPVAVCEERLAHRDTDTV
ncbi:MAG: hypothetical protein SangKO_005700 [Sandaracinaceae bacterium]